MAEINIEKKVPLDFLDGDHKDDYLLFKAIPVKEYKDFTSKLEGFEQDNTKAIAVLTSILENKFLSGKFNGQDVTKDNIGDFDLETLTNCFARLTGQSDPKGVN